MQEKEIVKQKIRHLPLTEPLCIQSGTRVSDVISRMRAETQNCVLVCRENRCLGIFTERDILSKVLGNADSYDLPVDGFMSGEPECLTLDETLGKAIEILHETGYRNIPLVDEKGNCTGLLQLKNIIDFFAELFPQEVLNVPPRPEQNFGNQDGA